MRLALLLSLVLPFVPPITPSVPASADDLVRAMHDKYKGSWYTTATFVQKTTQYGADGTQKEATWYEAMSMPGSLRIDFGPPSDGNGALYAANKVYSFKNGTLQTTRDQIHPLLLLGFDVYMLEPEHVLEELKTLGFDLSVFHTDTWQDRPAFVVGARAGDLRSAQFWIDAERLYFVRMIRPSGPGGARIQETQFNKYERLAGGWMAPEVVFKTDGAVTTTEQYSELRANVQLDPRLFDPKTFTDARWR